ncbi:MAG TPA: serine/threonine-protein kinase [Ktedonobacterales bacterium]|nr:serine/threonine-protein kinase [Ktedonobacterales bacterium]
MGESASEASDAVMIADRFRVVARVGLGGTAVVYRCVDHHSGHVVAVKVLRTNGPQIPAAEGRFRREARLASLLMHRHIVRVLDFGYTAPPEISPRVPWAAEGNQPVPYLAMEYVYGPNLKDLVRRYGPLPTEWVWTVGDQLCSALEAAHAVGVVHRDMKPQNVMLVDSRIEMMAKLTDFGIARQVNADYTALTVFGQVLGTPDYLSPEQVMGEPGDPASDIYSLGIVLYEMLTGHLPFEAETPLAAASRRMVADPPPVAHHRPDVPAALQEVVMLATQRDATVRPASARAFAELLRWSRLQSPITAPNPPGEWLVDRRLTQRPPEPIAAALAADEEPATPAPAAALPTSGESA